MTVGKNCWPKIYVNFFSCYLCSCHCYFCVSCCVYYLLFLLHLLRNFNSLRRCQKSKEFSSHFPRIVYIKHGHWMNSRLKKIWYQFHSLFTDFLGQSPMALLFCQECRDVAFNKFLECPCILMSFKKGILLLLLVVESFKIEFNGICLSISD